MQGTAVLLTEPRINGRDKALLEIYGETILEIIYYKLKTIFDKIFIVSNSYDQQSIYSKILSEDVLIDSNKNMLSLMHTGLKACRSKSAFVLSCGMPLVNKKVIPLILAKETPEIDAVVPRYANSKLEPLHALYKKDSTLKALEAAMNDERFKFEYMLENLGDVYYMPVGELMDVDPKLNTFVKINSEIDFEKIKENFKEKVLKKRLSKAKFLESKIKKDIETLHTIYFKVPGSEEEHEVRLNKRNENWSCDCKHFTMKGTYCSHILAAQNLIKNV